MTSTYTLLVSTWPTRGAPVVLNGASLQGRAYIFTSDSAQNTSLSGIRQVRYWLDDPAMSGPPTHVEDVTPYDFAGTSANGTADPWDASMVAMGNHTIAQSVTTASGTVQTYVASFTVDAIHDGGTDGGLGDSGGTNAHNTYTAASCNYADVNAMINGPTHTLQNGDTIIIPTIASNGNQNCIWTSQLQYAGTADQFTIRGASQTQTIIVDNVSSPSNGGLMNFSNVQVNGSLATPDVRLSHMTILLQNAATFQWILQLTGNCSASTCSQVRIDNILWGTPSSKLSANNNTLYYVGINDAFGVFDHNNVQSTGGGLFGIYLPGYQGAGGNGDNSWAQPDSYGTANAFYVENNTISGNGTKLFMLGCETPGARCVFRFNNTTDGNLSGHGTETSGRKRSINQIETYGNIFAANGVGMPNVLDQRGGHGLFWGNQIGGSAHQQCASGSGNCPYKSGIELETHRICNDLGGWGTCDGTGPWDKNDGATNPVTSTFTAVASGTYTDTNMGTVVANQFAPPANQGSGTHYTLVDLTANNVNAATVYDITGNTACPGSCQITTASPILGAAKGDKYVVLGTTSYYKGTFTGVSGSTFLEDANATWAAGSWQPTCPGANCGKPYSVRNTTQGWGSEIISTGAGGTATLVPSFGGGQNNRFNAGDNYEILRASVCIDMTGYGHGNLLSGNPLLTAGWPQDAHDPVYEWGDAFQNYTGTGSSIAPMTTGASTGGTQSTSRVAISRDFYMGTFNQGPQISRTSPFDGSATLGDSAVPGTGYGTKTNRPVSCAAGTAYYATDEGSWNTTASSPFPPGTFGGTSVTQGNLYICQAGNTWPASPNYTPHTYPHPLTAGP
jgi:hypothetical protein